MVCGMRYMLKFRGLYMGNDDRFTADFTELENKGFTHIISGFSGILSCYSPPLPWTTLVRVEDFIDRMDGTDLKLVVSPLPFRDGNGVNYSPEDTDYTESFLENIELLVSNVDLGGFVFDDFVYPTQYVDNNRLVEQEQVLTDFITDTKNVVKRGSSNRAFFGISTGYWDYPASRISEFSKYTDYLFPQIYRVDGQSLGWFNTRLEYYLNLISGNPNIIPYICTYYKPDTIRSDLCEDISGITQRNLYGYNLFYYSYLPIIYNNRLKIVNRIRAVNRQPGLRNK